jgi:hypothetical protein
MKNPPEPQARRNTKITKQLTRVNRRAKTAQGYAIKFIQEMRPTRSEDRRVTSRTLYRLLHQLVVADELAGSRHAGIRHAHRHLQTVEGAAHVVWKVAVLGVRGGLLEGPEVVFAFVVFFFTTVAAVWTLGPVTAIVCSAMSVRAMLVTVLLWGCDCAAMCKSVCDILC